MQLDAYLRENDLSDQSFAKLLGPGISAWAVRKWRYGQRIPRLAQQMRIREATVGLVTPNDLIAAAEACVGRQGSGHSYDAGGRTTKGPASDERAKPLRCMSAHGSAAFATEGQSR